MFQSYLLISFCGYCILIATHLINMLHFQVAKYKSPYEVLFKKPHDYTQLRIFDCLCYILNIYSTPDKFATKAFKYVLLGYHLIKRGTGL